ncbi:MAG: glycosyltransferase [Actinobacteria bacterium]|nr:glycosyltransferase [Actinomycetota bacterium]
MDLFLLYHYIVAAVLLVIMINFIINNFLFKNTIKHKLPESFLRARPLISVLIPARNEENNIKRCINSILKQDYENLEILVLDDGSTDKTAKIVNELIKKDARIRLYQGKPLASGWLGKSYACQQLAGYSKGQYLLFVDADTLHFPTSVSSTVACLLKYNVDALSVFANQIMVTFPERMVIPFGNFMIMAFMPLALIRRSRRAIFCTAIGQFMLFKRHVYEAIGGHESVKGEILEDVIISKQVKRCGYRFMIFDGRSNLHCRMYHNFSEVVSGYSKVLFSSFDYRVTMISIAIVMIAAIYLMPFVMLPLGIFFDWQQIYVNIMILQVLFILITRIILSIRFRMKAVDILLYPLSVIYLLSIAVNSVLQYRFNFGICWKGRTYNIVENEDDEEELILLNDNYK